ncbi:MAG: class I SAM-dependent methyltransferase [Thermodesulfobacteriota bacterium]
MNKDLVTDYQWNPDHNQIPLYILDKLNMVLNKYKFNMDSRILDSGCGGGYFLNYLTEKKYSDVWGFDISPTGIEVINKLYPHLSSKVAVHDVFKEELPVYFPNKYDIVFSTEVIEHLYNPGLYLKNIYGLLKESGYLILSTPYHSYIKNLLISLSGKNDSHYNPNWVGGHIKFFSKKTIEELLVENKFKIEKFIGCGRVPVIWKSMLIVAKKS